MNNRDYPKVRRAAQKQGWRPIPTAKGEMLLAPDGLTKVTWHRAHRSSDPSALDALVRDMKRAGFRWPPPRERRG
jgi:hypothetical protein